MHRPPQGIFLDGFILLFVLVTKSHKCSSLKKDKDPIFSDPAVNDACQQLEITQSFATGAAFQNQVVEQLHNTMKINLYKHIQSGNTYILANRLDKPC